MTDISNDAYIARVAICEAASGILCAWTAPHVLYKPKLMQDGTAWCALYGENLQEGVAGFGETPAAAMAAFDAAWLSEKTPAAMIAARKAE
jgi:hypothetical protein